METTDPETLPSNDDTEAWKVKIIDYYRQNAPMKVRMVNANMMSKYEGKYDTLWANLIKKYGQPGQPIASAVAPGAGGKKSIGDFHEVRERELRSENENDFAVSNAMNISPMQLATLVTGLRQARSQCYSGQ